MARILDWVPVERGKDNIADVAISELLPGVEAIFEPNFHSRSVDNHDPGFIAAGVKEPKVGDELTLWAGVSKATVKKVNRSETLGGFDFTGLTLLDVSRNPLQEGDSGAPCLFKVASTHYRMSCIVFARANRDGSEVWAFPASVAERELGITFGEPGFETNRGTPVLTSEGFVGQRMVIDDYFQAGETLRAGGCGGYPAAGHVTLLSQSL